MNGVESIRRDLFFDKFRLDLINPTLVISQNDAGKNILKIYAKRHIP